MRPETLLRIITRKGCVNCCYILMVGDKIVLAPFASPVDGLTSLDSAVEGNYLDGAYSLPLTDMIADLASGRSSVLSPPTIELMGSPHPCTVVAEKRVRIAIMPTTPRINAIAWIALPECTNRMRAMA
ncbi:MAG: hypothetical protein EXS55_01530 [Candidatus Magasanikbacteria bacterium]|nr:hypothetical protein [Candidatus Magasanikbacteria bacterium]